MRFDDQIPEDEAAEAARAADVVAAEHGGGPLDHLAENDTPAVLDPRVGMPVDDPLQDPRDQRVGLDVIGEDSQG
jgi:hypothetical protein